MPLNINNPFQPKKVEMSNYHPEQIEQNKLKQAAERTQKANGRIGEYSTNYHERRYSDVIPQPKRFGDVLPQPKRFGDVLPQQKRFGDVLPQQKRFGDNHNQ